MSTRVRATTIRATTDILHKPNKQQQQQQQQQLFPAAALRICDHHLHSSGIIPRIHYDSDSARDDAATRIYEHDWFCVSQAVQCFAHSSISPVLGIKDVDTSSSPLLHRVVNGTDPCYCDVWVDTDSIGKSSIQFGGLVSIGSDVLAMVRRVFVRMSSTPKNCNSEGSSSGGSNNTLKLKSAPFSDQEKQRFRERFGFDALGISQNYKASDAKLLRDMIQIKRPDFDSDRLKTRITELESLSSLSTSSSSSPSPISSTQHQEEQPFIARVTVGPQHINFGNHADHAFLAETAFHALSILSTKQQSSSSSCDDDYVSIQYVSEVFLGDVLESYAAAHRRHDETYETGVDSSIILVATRKSTGERKVVLIAQSK
jgi:hypothetical protein